MPEKGWFVFDQAGLDAGACPEETSTDPVGDGWAVSADTLEELAKVIEVPEDELLKTVKQWNEFVDKGEDLAFYRPSDTLTGLNQPPYYAMLCVPALLNTDGGPVRNEKGEILDRSGGLFRDCILPVSSVRFGAICTKEVETWGSAVRSGGYRLEAHSLVRSDRRFRSRLLSGCSLR